MPKILSITDAMNACKGYQRPMREGEEIVESGFIISVGLFDKNDSVLKVQSLVLRTSGLTQNPYLIEVSVDLSKPYGSRVVQEKSECDCKAGPSEKCKHIMGLLLYLSRTEESDLEDLSCTDIRQQWGQLKTSTLQNYEAQQLVDLCHVNKQRDAFVSSMKEVTEDMKKAWVDRLTKCAPSSEYAMFECGIREGEGMFNKVAKSVGSASASLICDTDLAKNMLTFKSWAVMGQLRVLTEQKVLSLSDDVRQFYQNNVELTLEESVSIACEMQGTPKWLEERKKRLTASNARSQYTYLGNKKANWEKRYQDVYHSNFFGNEDTLRGLRCEPIARELYEDLQKCRVIQTGLLVRPELPWVAASLDGTVYDGKRFLKNIEIKTSKEGSRLTAEELLEMKAIKSLDENGNMRQAHDHYGQVQIGMFVSGISGCDYLVFSEIGKDYVLRTVAFDPKYVLDLLSRLVTVYFDIFLPKIARDFADNRVGGA